MYRAFANSNARSCAEIAHSAVSFANKQAQNAIVLQLGHDYRRLESLGLARHPHLRHHRSHRCVLDTSTGELLLVEDAQVRTGCIRPPTDHLLSHLGCVAAARDPLHRNRMGLYAHDSTCESKCDSVWGAAIAFLVVFLVIIIVSFALGWCQCCTTQSSRALMLFWLLLFIFFIIMLIFWVSCFCKTMRG